MKFPITSSKHAIIPCSPASTTQPQLLQVPGLAAAAGSGLYHGAARESWSGSSTASQLSLSSTAAHRRSAKGREGRWSHISEHWQVCKAPSQPIVSRRREHALDVLEREHGAGNVSHQVLRSGLSFQSLTEPTNGSFNFASSRSEWPMTGFVSIAVTSLNSIAQLAVVFKCKLLQRNSSLAGFNHNK